MKAFVSAQPASPASPAAQRAGILYAGIITIFALAQLYSFEDFILILPSALGVTETAGIFLLAPLIVVMEVFSLPYLLRMNVSPAFRIVSRVFGWFVPIFWIVIAVFVGLTADNSGILGGVVMVPGLTTASIGLLLFVIAAYANYQMRTPLKK